MLGGIVILGLIFLPGPQTQGLQVDLPRGSTLRSVSDTLDERGVLRSGFIFRAYVQVRGQASSLKAGEFNIPAGVNMEMLLQFYCAAMRFYMPLPFQRG